MTGSIYGDYNKKITLNPTTTSSNGNIEQLEKEEESLFSQINSLQEEQNYSDIENSFIEASSARIEELNEKKADITSNISTQETTVNNISTSINEQNQVINTISQNLSSLVAPNQNDYATSVTDEDGNTTITYPGYTEALAEYNNQLSQLEEELSSAETVLDELETDLETAQADLEDLSNSLTEVTEELQELSSESNIDESDKASEQEDTQAEIAALQEELNSVRTELAAVKEAQAAAQIKAEESKINEDDNNFLENASEQLNSDKDVNSSNDLDINSEEEIKTVSLEDITELANNARTIINSLSFDNETYTKAISEVLETINTVNNGKYNTEDEDTQNYINLVNDLDELITARESIISVSSGNSDEEDNTAEAEKSSERTEDEIEDDIQSEITEMYKKILNLDNSDASDVISNAIALAYSLVGIEEENGNNDGEDLSKIIQATGCNGTLGDENTVGDSWCVFFANYIYGAGQNENITTEEAEARELFDTYLSSRQVTGLKEEAIEKGYFKYKDEINSETGETYEPAAGDIIVLNENDASHVGLVVYSDDNYVYTIEGNADNKVRMKKYDKTCTENTKYEDVTGYISMSEIYGGSTSSVNLDYINEEDFELAVKDEATR